MTIKFKFIFVCLSFLLFGFTLVKSQVSLLPTIFVIDKDSKNATVEVKNPSKEVREYSLEFKFGHIQYDSLGVDHIIYNDSLMASKYSLVPFLKMFPRKLIIPPGESQLVRIFLKNIPNENNMTYWSRLIASSDPVVQQIDTVNLPKVDSGFISTRINLKTSVVGLVLFHQGNVTSTVDFNFFRSFSDSLGMHMLCKFDKGGTSPFLGASLLKVYDSNNNLLIEKQDRVNIYENSIVAFDMPAKSLIHGKLKIELTINNERPGLAEASRLPFIPLTKTFELEY